MTWNGKKTLCVDFDGVVHLYESPWAGIHVVSDKPHPNAWDALAQYVEHFNVCIYSARSSEPAGIEAMKAWFVEHGCPAEVYTKLEFSSTKPIAFVYLDDRAWRFEGIFPSAEELKDFKPWNKR